MACWWAISSAVGFLLAGGDELSRAGFCGSTLRARALDESVAFAGRALDAAAGLAEVFLFPDRGPLGLGRTFLVFGFFIPLRAPAIPV